MAGHGAGPRGRIQYNWEYRVWLPSCDGGPILMGGGVTTQDVPCGQWHDGYGSGEVFTYSSQTSKRLELRVTATGGGGSATSPIKYVCVGDCYENRTAPGTGEGDAPRTKQALSDSILRSLYHGLYKPAPDPVGLAFRGAYALVGGLLVNWSHARDEFEAAETSEDRELARQKALYTRLAGLDRQSLVILGDPAVGPPSVTDT